MHGHLIDCRSSLPELPSGPSERKVLGGSIMIFLFDTAQMSRKPQTSPLPVGVLAPVVVGTAWEELRRVNWPRPCPPWTQTSCETGIGDSGLLSDASLDSDAGGQEHGDGCPCSCPTAVRRMDGWQKFQPGRDVKARATRHDTSWRSLELNSVARKLDGQRDELGIHDPKLQYIRPSSIEFLAG